MQLCMCCCPPGADWCMCCGSQFGLTPATVLRPLPCCVHHAVCVLFRLQQMAASATTTPLLPQRLQHLLPLGPKGPGAGLGSSRYGHGSLVFWQSAEVMACSTVHVCMRRVPVVCLLGDLCPLHVSWLV